MFEALVAQLGTNLVDLLSNPTSLILFLIRFLLGFALGYISLRAIKYLVAMLAIIAIGMFLNIWEVDALKRALEEAGLELEKLDWQKVIEGVIRFLGLTTMLPIGVGFILGIVVAIIRETR